MDTRKSIFNGQRFQYPEDFEKAFRPTKWSIRKFRDFLVHLPVIEVSGFTEYTVWKLNEFYSDKGTREFINLIRDKSRSGGWFSREKREGGKAILVEVDERSINDFLVTMVLMKKNRIIGSTGKRLAETIKSNFNTGLSLSTIRDKLYKIEAEINQNLINDLEGIKRRVFKN